MPIDMEKLLRPISEEAPCGPNLEYAGVDELDRIAQGTPERQVGTSIIPAEEPDWRDVQSTAIKLLEKTHDLRVVIQLTKALIKLEGLCGLREALTLLQRMIEPFWGCVYPQLDAEDDNDPTERLNALRAFSSKEAKGDESPLIRMVREARLCYSARLREGFSMRDVLVASGEMKPASGGAIEMGRIETAFGDTDPAALEASAAAATDCVQLVTRLETFIDGRVGAGRGIHFGDLRTLLGDIARRLNGALGRRGLGSGPPADGGDSTPAAGGNGAAGGAGGRVASAGAPISGEVQSTADVTRLLDKICDFYTRTEPSSPVPLILKRARRLVGRNFWELIQDLSPVAVDAIRTITGSEPPPPPES